MKGADFFFPSPIEEDKSQTSKMMEIMASGVRGFRRDPTIIQERGVDEGYGAVDVYEHLAPIIDTDVCMGFLKTLVTAKGAELITRYIEGNLFDQETALRQGFSADAIINATGLGAEKLAGDETCYPIRGALLRVINNGVDVPKIDHAMNISADVDSSGEIVFLVPRNDNILLIGGIAEQHEHGLDLTLDSPSIKRMRAHCESFMPALKNARLDPEYPLAQGLRPFRQRNVRVERELRVHRTTGNGDRKGKVSRIVHNYGHGGAGWSLSFGCAGDVLALVEEALLDLPARSMSSGLVRKNVTRSVVVKRQQTPVIGESAFPVRARL
jgi:glycine/D-amino acid oxidase-like deaminating enzyme